MQHLAACSYRRGSGRERKALTYTDLSKTAEESETFQFLAGTQPLQHSGENAHRVIYSRFPLFPLLSLKESPPPPLLSLGAIAYRERAQEDTFSFVSVCAVQVT